MYTFMDMDMDVCIYECMYVYEYAHTMSAGIWM